jgi:hypothetical protein
MLGCLRAAGLSQGRAAWGFDLLMLQVTARAAEQEHRRAQKDPVGRARDAYEHADADPQPHIGALRRELISGTGADRTAWALNVCSYAGSRGRRRPPT